MSASFYDLLKFAKTGIASPDMTAYDKQKALAMCKAGFPVKTLTGVPPISFKSDGSALTAWSISGNMSQSGTPTPDAPITPQETGDKTDNLYAWKYTSTWGVDGTGQNRTVYNTAYTRSSVVKLKPNTQYTLSAKAAGSIDAYCRIAIFDEKPQIESVSTHYYFSSGDSPITFTTGADEEWGIVVQNNASAASIDLKRMLNEGSTAQPYEPYGYKIPITNAGHTQTVYLSEPLRKIGDYGDTVEQDGTVTRRIKKYEFTGAEEGWANIGGNAPYRLLFSDIVGTSDRDAVLFMCSHYQAVSNNASWAQLSTCVSWGFSAGMSVRGLQFRDTSCANLDAFKAYLAAQYAAGTPVTVWYVLANPTTETVTVPTLTPTKGSNTLSIGTTLAPSEVSITGGIK